MPLLNWLMGNIKSVIEFLKEHAIEVHVKKKTTEEIQRTIRISNVFILFIISLVVLAIYILIKL